MGGGWGTLPPGRGTLPTRATEGDGAATFRGSISRRLTALSVLLLILVAAIGGFSVHRARRIVRLHTEIEGLTAHTEVLGRVENLISHLRSEAQDALFLGKGLDDPDLSRIPREIHDQWKRFELMHSREGVPWKNAPIAERVLYQELDQTLDHFISRAQSVVADRKRGVARLREAAIQLHGEAHHLEGGLQRLSALHRDLIAARSQVTQTDMRFILWTYGIFISLLGLAVAAASVLFVRQMALPLRRLNAAALDVAGGNFTRRVPVTSRDEIGMLAHTFNRMAEDLSERDAQVRRRTQEAEAFHRIGTDISSLLQIDRIITSVVESTRGLFRADAAGLALADGSSQDIRWTVFVGGGEEAFRQSRLRFGQGVAGRVVATGTPLAVEDAAGETGTQSDAYPVLTAEGFRAALAVPLRRGDRTRGALMVAYRTPRRFAEEETVLLSSFANQVAVALENAELYEQVQMLHRVGIQISSTLKLDPILRTVVDSARAILRTDVAGLCLLRDGSPVLDLAVTAGAWEAVMGLESPVLCVEPSNGPGATCQHCQAVRSERGVSQLSAPLTLGDRVLGALCVGGANPRSFSEAERDLLGGLAAQAAIAIENARLYEAVRGMAALEERERIAREMHDGLAQALGFLNLRLSVTERMLDGGLPGPIRQELAEMRKVTGEAYEEVRQAIFGLRTMVSRGLGLVPTLSEYLHEFSQQAGIQVRLEVSEGDALLRLNPEVEVQLVRIVQEALHNVRKHSESTTAQVRLWREAEDLLVAIQDDGTGFDPVAPPADGRRHFGLATMRERAESVGGTLGIQSAPGTGTQVRLRLPLAGAARGGTA